MRAFIVVFVLIFSLQSLTKADDIKDFEIEGMSIGDSLLDYFSVSEIKGKINSDTTYFYKNNGYVSILIESENFEIYEQVGVVFNPADKKFILESIEGTFNYNSDIDECYKKQEVITSDLKRMFINNTEFSTYTIKYTPDKSGKSISKNNRFKFSNGDAITVICYDMNKDFHDPNDQLYLAISSKKLLKWIHENT